MASKSLERSQDLALGDDLAEQARALRRAVEEFHSRIGKYESSLGTDTARSKARTIPRKIQFFLVIDVEKLRNTITQPQIDVLSEARPTLLLSPLWLSADLGLHTDTLEGFLSL